MTAIPGFARHRIDPGEMAGNVVVAVAGSR